MNALLLCAGVGERLMPLTLYRPKCMLPATKYGTLLKYWISELMWNGIDTVFINVFWLKKEIVSYLNELDFQANYYIYEEKNLEPIGEVLHNLKEKLGDEFFIINSDTYITEGDISNFIKTLSVTSGSPICLGVTLQENVVGKSLVTMRNDDTNLISTFLEKPIVACKGLSYGGIMKMHSSVLDMYDSETLKRKELTGGILSDYKGNMTAENVGDVVDIGGSIEEYLYAYEKILLMECE